MGTKLCKGPQIFFWQWTNFRNLSPHSTVSFLQSTLTGIMWRAVQTQQQSSWTTASCVSQNPTWIQKLLHATDWSCSPLFSAIAFSRFLNLPTQWIGSNPFGVTAKHFASREPFIALWSSATWSSIKSLKKWLIHRENKKISWHHKPFHDADSHLEDVLLVQFQNQWHLRLDCPWKHRGKLERWLDKEMPLKKLKRW